MDIHDCYRFPLIYDVTILAELKKKCEQFSLLQLLRDDDIIIVGIGIEKSPKKFHLLAIECEY